MKKSTLYIFLTMVVLGSMLLGACAPAAEQAPAAESQSQQEEAVAEQESGIDEEQQEEAPAVEEPVEEIAAEEAVDEAQEEAAEVAEAVVITDSSGNTVELASLPQRVVIAGKATPFTLSTTYLFEEASERVVAQEMRGMTMPDFLSLIDPKYDEKITLEMDSGAEQIAPVKPDIVIVKNYTLKNFQEILTPLDIPVVGLNMEQPDVFYNDVTMLGQLFGNAERAEEINSFMHEKVALVADAMQGLAEEEKPSVLVLQYSEKDGEVAFNVPPASYIQTKMIQDGGGNPIWTDGSGEESGWILVNFEQIAVWNPDMIFVIDYNGNPQESAAKLAQSDTWQELNAVKNGQVYGFGKDYLSWDLPDARWILGYTWSATKLQPERMAGVDMDEMVKEFYRVMYRLDDEQIETSIMPLVVAP